MERLSVVSVVGVMAHRESRALAGPLRVGRAVSCCVALALSIGLAGVWPTPGAARRAVAAPRVVGPRTTRSDHPVYRFEAARATGFLCSFDTPALHTCAARYSEG